MRDLAGLERWSWRCPRALCSGDSDLRLRGAFGHVEDVLALRSKLNARIERELKGKTALAHMRNRERRDGQRCV